MYMYSIQPFWEEWKQSHTRICIDNKFIFNIKIARQQKEQLNMIYAQFSEKYKVHIFGGHIITPTTCSSHANDIESRSTITHRKKNYPMALSFSLKNASSYVGFQRKQLRAFI